MDSEIGASCHGNNVVDDLKKRVKIYLKEKMERVGYLKTNKTSNVGMIPCASKDGSSNFLYQCLNIISHKYRMNGLKECNEM